jgi:hypothetical protein
MSKLHCRHLQLPSRYHLSHRKGGKQQKKIYFFLSKIIPKDGRKPSRLSRGGEENKIKVDITWFKAIGGWQ